MSHWSYIQGTVEVDVPGRTQPEKEYILKTVLQHLPVVPGSERDMSVHICMRKGMNGFSSCDEFGRNWNPVVYDQNGNLSESGSLETQESYLLVVEGKLRDTTGKEAYRQFIRWLTRLSGRIPITDVLVRVWDGVTNQQWLVNEPDGHCRFEMYPEEGEPVWTDYLMWEPEKDSWYPKKLDERFRGAYS